MASHIPLTTRLQVHFHETDSNFWVLITTCIKDFSCELACFNLTGELIFRSGQLGSGPGWFLQDSLILFRSPSICDYYPLIPSESLRSNSYSFLLPNIPPTNILMIGTNPSYNICYLSGPSRIIRATFSTPYCGLSSVSPVNLKVLTGSSSYDKLDKIAYHPRMPNFLVGSSSKQLLALWTDSMRWSITTLREPAEQISIDSTNRLVIVLHQSTLLVFSLALVLLTRIDIQYHRRGPNVILGMTLVNGSAILINEALRLHPIPYLKELATLYIDAAKIDVERILSIFTIPCIIELTIKGLVLGTSENGDQFSDACHRSTLQKFCLHDSVLNTSSFLESFSNGLRSNNHLRTLEFIGNKLTSAHLIIDALNHNFVLEKITFTGTSNPLSFFNLSKNNIPADQMERIDYLLSLPNRRNRQIFGPCTCGAHHSCLSTGDCTCLIIAPACTWIHCMSLPFDSHFVCQGFRTCRLCVNRTESRLSKAGVELFSSSDFEYIPIRSFEGTTSTVRLARLVLTDEPVVAIKTFKAVAWIDTAFEKEVITWHSARHPDIVKIYGIVRGSHQIVLEIMDPISLSSYLYGSHRRPILWQIRWKYIVHICNGLVFLHQTGIIHRDIKASNILLTSETDFNQKQAKISDFGTARSLSCVANTRLYYATSPTHAAPELSCYNPGTTQTDMFALSVLLFEVYHQAEPWLDFSEPQLTEAIANGEKPPVPTSEFSILASRGDWPPEFHSIWKRCGSVKPEERPSANELEELTHLSPPLPDEYSQYSDGDLAILLPIRQQTGTSTERPSSSSASPKRRHRWSSF